VCVSERESVWGGCLSVCVWVSERERERKKEKVAAQIVIEMLGVSWVIAMLRDLKSRAWIKDKNDSKIVKQ